MSERMTNLTSVLENRSGSRVENGRPVRKSPQPCAVGVKDTQGRGRASKADGECFLKAVSFLLAGVCTLRGK